LRRAGDKLREIETDIEIAVHDRNRRTRHQQLYRMIGRLDELACDYAEKGIPLFHRTARARLYFDQMKKMLEDLGVEPIPQWQSYDQFLRRRLFAQHEFTANLGNRISQLWELARSRAEVAEAEALSWLERGAQWASLIILPLAAADMLRGRTSFHSIVGFFYNLATGSVSSVGSGASSSVRPASDSVILSIVSWWKCPEIQEFWLVYVLSFVGWLAVIRFLLPARNILSPRGPNERAAHSHAEKLGQENEGA
jgi:hypothetical protein